MSMPNAVISEELPSDAKPYNIDDPKPERMEFGRQVTILVNYEQK